VKLKKTNWAHLLNQVWVELVGLWRIWRGVCGCLLTQGQFWRDLLEGSREAVEHCAQFCAYPRTLPSATGVLATLVTASETYIWNIQEQSGAFGVTC
jgi:hypothetical protein